MTQCMKILCGVIVKKRIVSFEKRFIVKGEHDFENPENLPTLIVLDDLMDLLKDHIIVTSVWF